MALNYISIILGIIVLVSYLAILFFLLQILARIQGKTKTAFIYFTISIFFLIIRRVQDIFYKIDLISAPYLYDTLSIIFSVLLLLTAYHFYNAITEVTDKIITKEKKHKVSKKVGRNIKRFENVKEITNAKSSKIKGIVKGDYLDLTR